MWSRRSPVRIRSLTPHKGPPNAGILPIDSVLDAKRSAAEKQPAAVDAGLDHLRQAIDGYIASTQDVAGLLATAGRDNRVPGQEEAGDFRRSLKGATSLPTPIVEAD